MREWMSAAAWIFPMRRRPLSHFCRKNVKDRILLRPSERTLLAIRDICCCCRDRHIYTGFSTSV